MGFVEYYLCFVTMGDEGGDHTCDDGGGCQSGNWGKHKDVFLLLMLMMRMMMMRMMIMRMMMITIDSIK